MRLQQFTKRSCYRIYLCVDDIMQECSFIGYMIDLVNELSEYLKVGSDGVYECVGEKMNLLDEFVVVDAARDGEYQLEETFKGKDNGQN